MRIKKLYVEVIPEFKDGSLANVKLVIDSEDMSERLTVSRKYITNQFVSMFDQLFDTLRDEVKAHMGVHRG